VISLLVKLSKALKPFHKLTYLLAFLIIANLAYQFLFSSIPTQPENKEAMFSLLALVWLALINLMLNVFTQIPERKREKFIFAKIKSKLHQLLYYLLSLVFICLSIALIILSLKMVRL
jgi:hypothetical protein